MATLKQRSEALQRQFNDGVMDNVTAAGHLLIAHGDFLTELERRLDATDDFEPSEVRRKAVDLFDWLWHQIKEIDNDSLGI